MLIDSHSHIHFEKEFPDANQVLINAQEAGVLKQIIIGTNIQDSFDAARFAGEHDGIFWAAGIHPHDALEATPDNLAKLRNLLSRSGEFVNLKKAPVAVGEIGLDYFRNLSPVDVQKKAFSQMLEIAGELNLPVVVHVRDAFDDALEILDQADNKKVVFHCFSGNLAQAEQCWKRGFITSFAGVVTYPKNLDLQEVARLAPQDKFILETDCPFLAPQKYRGKRNEPAFVAETARFVAELRGVSLESVAECTTENVERFFEI